MSDDKPVVPSWQTMTGGNLGGDSGWGASVFNDGVQSGGLGQGGIGGIGKGVSSALSLDYLNHTPGKADTQAPGAPPTLGSANMAAATQELQNERNMKSTWTTLTGGQGLVDTPTTASRTLLGN